MADRLALAREVDGEELADALNDWGEETAANRLRWHSVILAALGEDGERRVADSRAITVEELAPRDPDEEDPAVYVATVRMDARIEGPGEHADVDEYEDVEVPVWITATLGRTPEGPVEVILHDVSSADDADEV